MFIPNQSRFHRHRQRHPRPLDRVQMVQVHQVMPSKRRPGQAYRSRPSMAKRRLPLRPVPVGKVNGRSCATRRGTRRTRRRIRTAAIQTPMPRTRRTMFPKREAAQVLRHSQRLRRMHRLPPRQNRRKPLAIERGRIVEKIGPRLVQRSRRRARKLLQHLQQVNRRSGLKQARVQ